MSTQSIFDSFPITTEEYQQLDEKFENLVKFASWQLRRRNVKNNPGMDLDDFIQELRMSLLFAGSYYKRQIYIESCLTLAKRYAKDDFTKDVVKELYGLWQNRTRHGANRQKYGPYQERLLERIVRQVVPKKLRPKKDKPLQFDSKFITYCKSITWNKQKSLGRKISKDRTIRCGQVSISQFSHLDGEFVK